MMTRAMPSTVAAPPMSFFMRSMPSAGLMSLPPVSNTTPLPHNASNGLASVAWLPRQENPATSGGAGSPGTDGGHGGIIPRQRGTGDTMRYRIDTGWRA